MQRQMVRVGMVGTLVGFGIVSLAYGQVADQVRSRQKISLMESVLESAVANGADSLLREVRSVLPPDALMLTGAPQARGFRLEGYGLFFDVEVPAFRRTMAWTLRTMVDEHGLAVLLPVPLHVREAALEAEHLDRAHADVPRLGEGRLQGVGLGEVGKVNGEPISGFALFICGIIGLIVTGIIGLKLVT